MPSLTMSDIYQARQRIAPVARRTPLSFSPLLSKLAGSAVHLKLECLQETGSFKLRGAANKLFSLTPEEKARGVITVSSGNHGRAVSYVAHRLGIKATVCVSTHVPQNKKDAIRGLGAQLVVHGDSYEEAEARSIELQKEYGLVPIQPFDDPLVIAGQGTIGIELLEDLEIDTAIVPLSGGGLISGIALALKSANPGIRVIGVSMERGPVMHYSLQAGHPIQMPEEDTLADALAGGIGLDNQYTFRMVRDYVDETVLVSEEEIGRAMAFAFEKHHLVVEGGGAVGLAALLQQKVTLGQHVVVVISGSNVDTPLLLRLVQEYASEAR